MTSRHRPARLTTTLTLLLALATTTAWTSTRADSGTTLQPPALTILHNSPADAKGYVFVAPKRTSATTGQQGPEIVDDQGRPIWFQPLANGDQALDFRVQRYHGGPFSPGGRARATPGRATVRARA
jgi:hypothetical protein